MWFRFVSHRNVGVIHGVGVGFIANGAEQLCKSIGINNSTNLVSFNDCIHIGLTYLVFLADRDSWKKQHIQWDVLSYVNSAQIASDGGMKRADQQF